eukprot:479187-Amorphochlora_amoeboformis.AAC.1
MAKPLAKPLVLPHIHTHAFPRPKHPLIFSQLIQPNPQDPIGGSNTIHNTTNSIASSHSGTGSNSRQSRTATGDKETASTGST